MEALPVCTAVRYGTVFCFFVTAGRTGIGLQSDTVQFFNKSFDTQVNRLCLQVSFMARAVLASYWADHAPGALVLAFLLYLSHPTLPLSPSLPISISVTLCIHFFLSVVLIM